MQIEAKVVDNMTPTLQRMLKKGHDFSPVMARVEREIFAPLKLTAWGRSGLHSISGELFRAVETWHGKSSAGVTLKKKKAFDLVPPKAVTHTYGRKKFSNKQGYKRIKIRGYDKRRGEDRHAKYVFGEKRRSPWGDIPARPFFPTKRDFDLKQKIIFRMIQEHLSNV